MTQLQFQWPPATCSSLYTIQRSVKFKWSRSGLEACQTHAREAGGCYKCGVGDMGELGDGDQQTKFQRVETSARQNSPFALHLQLRGAPEEEKLLQDKRGSHRLPPPMSPDQSPIMVRWHSPRFFPSNRNARLLKLRLLLLPFVWPLPKLLAPFLTQSLATDGAVRRCYSPNSRPHLGGSSKHD